MGFLFCCITPYVSVLITWCFDYYRFVVLSEVGMILGLPRCTVVKNLPANAGDTRDVGLIPGSGRSPRLGNDNPLQYSCLENSMGRGAWRAKVHGVTKSWTWLSNWTDWLIVQTEAEGRDQLISNGWVIMSSYPVYSLWLILSDECLVTDFQSLSVSNSPQEHNSTHTPGVCLHTIKQTPIIPKKGFRQ